MNIMQAFRDGLPRSTTKRRRGYRVNWWALLLAGYWLYWQNRYYGWNRTPQSDMELIADGIFFLMLLFVVRPAHNGEVPRE
jgi:hypothetical protein